MAHEDHGEDHEHEHAPSHGHAHPHTHHAHHARARARPRRFALRPLPPAAGRGKILFLDAAERGSPAT